MLLAECHIRGSAPWSQLKIRADIEITLPRINTSVPAYMCMAAPCFKEETDARFVLKAGNRCPMYELWSIGTFPSP
jgi:hypothetical protein